MDKEQARIDGGGLFAALPDILLHLATAIRSTSDFGQELPVLKECVEQATIAAFRFRDELVMRTQGDR